MRSQLDQALECAALGQLVFPVGADDGPLAGLGTMNATDDLATIERWWTRWPDAMVAAFDPGDERSAPLTGAALTGEASKLRLLDTKKLLTTEPEPLDWLASGVWCRGKLTLFGGREKRGKSLVQLLMGTLMASGGGEIVGLDVKPGRVLLIDAENGEREIHRRLRSAGLAAEHAGNFVIAEARGFELREQWPAVANLAEREAVDLILLDSFRSLWRGDERDEAECAEALDPIRQYAHETDRAISLVHHAQKGGEEYRGSSAIGACVDWCVMLDRHREDDDKTRRRLANPLARFAPERPDRWLRICSEGDDGPVSLAAAEPFAHEQAAPVRDEIEGELQALIESVVPVVHPYIGEDTPTTPSWSTADLLSAVGRRRDDKTGRRAVQRLAARGVIHRNGDGRWHRSETLLDGDVPKGES